MAQLQANKYSAISIHSLREEGDLTACKLLYSFLFQSTPSARRETSQNTLCAV